MPRDWIDTYHRTPPRKDTPRGSAPPPSSPIWKKQVLLLEDDLRQRITLPEFDQPWRSEHAAATSGDRTAATYTAWAGRPHHPAAVSWVLTTVFVRFSV